MELNQVKIYRMTHIKNIPHILQFGISHKYSPNSNPDFVTIGDTSLIDTRSTKQVSVDNGSLSHTNASTVTLGDFIPFYFGIKMPMLYVIQHGGNFVERATPAEDIVYLACSIVSITELTTVYYFSDGHATDNLTTFYDKDKINELPSIIDWNSIKASFWGGQENLNTKRKKQAEFLVSEDIPPEFIIRFGCYNESAKVSLLKMGIKEDVIKLIPNAYY